MKPKEKVLYVRVSTDEKKEIRKAAHAVDVTVAQWVRATLLTEARKS